MYSTKIEFLKIIFKKNEKKQKNEKGGEIKFFPNSLL
jgi:hypothetical protein